MASKLLPWGTPAVIRLLLEMSSARQPSPLKVYQLNKCISVRDWLLSLKTSLWIRHDRMLFPHPEDTDFRIIADYFLAADFRNVLYSPTHDGPSIYTWQSDQLESRPIRELEYSVFWNDNTKLLKTLVAANRKMIFLLPTSYPTSESLYRLFNFFISEGRRPSKACVE